MEKRIFPEPFVTIIQDVERLNTEEVPIEKLKILISVPFDFLLDLALLPPSFIESTYRLNRNKR